MQWNDSDHAGFTLGKPWMKVNPNYQTINAKQQVEDETSIYHYYQKLIQLRHQMPIIVYGKYELLEKDHPDLFVYTREYQGEKLLVITNFSENEYDYDLNDFCNGQLLISNDNIEVSDKIHIQPYGAYVIFK